MIFSFPKQINLASAQLQGCSNHIYGERTLHWGHTLRENVIHTLGFLEDHRLPDIDPELYTYLSNLKHGLISNAIDIFGLFAYLIPISQLPLPEERVLYTLEELERLYNKQVCATRCAISKWRGNPRVRELFGLVPLNTILHNLPDTYEGLSEIADVGVKIASADYSVASSEEYKNFGKSISKILKEIQEVEHCANERFFGYLLSFYPWPNSDLQIHSAVRNLQYHLIYDQNLFIACNVSLNDFYQKINLPWALLDYLLFQMDFSHCIPQLEYDIKSLLEVEKKVIFGQPVTKPTNENLIDLLDVIAPDLYPPEIILAADRVYRYIRKLLALLDQDDFLQHFYDTPEAKLLSLLDHILRIEPYAIPDVLDAIKAVQAHLYFQTGPKKISLELLNYILNAWSAPDLLDHIKAQVEEMKKIVNENLKAINEALLDIKDKRCFGIVQCYAKIVSVLKSIPCFDRKITPPSCLLGISDVCPDRNPSIISDRFNDIITAINDHRYPHNAVLATHIISNHFQQSGLDPNITIPLGVCTKDEVILNILQSFLKDASMLPVQYNLLLITAEDKNKLEGLKWKPEPETPFLECVPNTDALIDLVTNSHNFQGVDLTQEMISALTHIGEYDQNVNEILKKAQCCNHSLPECFNNALAIFHDNPIFETIASPLRYVLNPTFCDNQGCHWIPYEEKECGMLNPTLVYFTHLLQNFRQTANDIQLGIDAESLLSYANILDTCAALSTCPIQLGASPEQTFLVMLQCLQQEFTNERLQSAVNNIAHYVESGEVPTTLPVENNVSQNPFTGSNYIGDEGTQFKDKLSDVLKYIDTHPDQLGNLLSNWRGDYLSFQDCLNNLRAIINQPVTQVGFNGYNNQPPVTIVQAIEELPVNVMVPPTTCSTEIRELLQNNGDYNQKIGYNIGNMASKPLTLYDLIKMLLILKQTYPTENTQLLENIDRLLTHIKTYCDEWIDLLATLSVNCSTPRNCLSNLQESLGSSINQAPNQVKTDIQNLLTEITDSVCTKENTEVSESGTTETHQIEYSTVGSLLKYLSVDDLVKMLLQMKQYTPAEYRDKIDKLLSHIYANYGAWNDFLSKLPLDCTNPHDCLSNLQEILSNSIGEVPNQMKADIQNLLTEIMNPGCDTQNVELSQSGDSDTHRIEYNNTYASSTISPVDALLKLLTEFKKDYLGNKEDIDKIMTHINSNRDQWNKLLTTLPIDCSNPQDCLKNLKASINEAASRSPNAMILEIQDLLSGVELPPTEADIIELMETLIHNPNTSLREQYDLKRLVNLLKNVDISPIITQVAQSKPKNILLELLRQLPSDLKEKYDITQSVDNLINSMVVGDTSQPYNLQNQTWPGWQLNETANNALNNLKQILSYHLLREDTPPPVKIALDYLLRQLQTPQLQALLQSNTSLPEFLESIVNNKDLSPILRNKVNVILQYSKNQPLPVPGLVNCADLHTLALILIESTGDAVIRDEIMTLNNKLFRLEQQCDQQLKDCPVECKSRESCARELRNCAEQTNSCVAWDMSHILLSASCTKQACGQAGEGLETLDTEPDTLIVFIETSQTDVNTVQLNLKDPNVANTLWEISHMGAIPNQQLVIRLQVSPGNFLRVAIDLTNSLLQQQLQALGVSDREAVLDCGSMATAAIVWVPQTGPVRWLTYDLRNPSVRQTLRQLTQRQVEGARPFVVMWHCDEPTYLLHIDFRDTAYYQKLLIRSIEGQKIIHNQTLLLFPGTTGIVHYPSLFFSSDLCSYPLYLLVLCFILIYLFLLIILHLKSSIFVTIFPNNF